MFPIILIYLTQVCTGFDATLTANLQSFKKWRAGKWIRFTLACPDNAHAEELLTFNSIEKIWELQIPLNWA